MGIESQVGARLLVYRRGEPTMHFGLPRYGYVGGSVPYDDTSMDIESVAWGRALTGGDSGKMVFTLPLRTYGETGEEWIDLIRANDWVELEVFVYRTPYAEEFVSGSQIDKDMIEEFGTTDGYECRFAGFVHQIQVEGDLENENTSVIVQDAMGILMQEHFGYWRNVGNIFQAGGNEALPSIIGGIQDAGYGANTALLEAGSIAVVTEVLFKSLLYKKLNVKWNINGKDYLWEQLHGYRFESDDFGINVVLNALAPDGSSWMDAVSWVVDAPQFYEFFMENVSRDDIGNKLKNGGARNLGQSNQVRTHDTGRELLGGRAEIFVLRPAPFPTYDPDKGGYQSAAWDGLKVIEALPIGMTSRSMSRGRQDIYSVFSVDKVNAALLNGSSAASADANARVTGDEEAYENKVGYRPLDVKTKRFETTYKYNKAGTEVTALGGDISADELTRRLAWQVFSFNHWNDRFVSGTITGPLDLRAEIGARYLHEGYLYYIEGYQHSLDVNGETTEFTLTRGLRASEYGFEGGSYIQHTQGPGHDSPSAKKYTKWFPQYLGRQRPGDTYRPLAGSAFQGITEGSGAQPGEHKP